MCSSEISPFSGSLHYQRYGDCLLSGARSADDGYGVGSGWCADGPGDLGAAQASCVLEQLRGV
jgi:hypothetical protein